MSRRRLNGALRFGLAIAGIGAVLVILIARSESLPEGVRPVVWDRTACAECRMAVSERGYAAQLQTRGGEVLDFDDPGCLFLYLDANEVDVHAIYFHHVREDRWLPAARAVFVEAGPSPMAFGLGAEDLGAAGGLSFEAAREKVRSRGPGGCCPHD